MARQLESYAHLDGMRIRSTHHDPHSTTCCADRLLKLADDAHAVKILRPFVRHLREQACCTLTSRSVVVCNDAPHHSNVLCLLY
jgi:hypothetical protein